MIVFTTVFRIHFTFFTGLPIRLKICGSVFFLIFHKVKCECPKNWARLLLARARLICIGRAIVLALSAHKYETLLVHIGEVKIWESKQQKLSGVNSH